MLPRESSSATVTRPQAAPADSKPGPLHHIYPGHALEHEPVPPVDAVAYCGHVKRAAGAHRWLTRAQADTCVVCWAMATAGWAA